MLFESQVAEPRKRFTEMTKIIGFEVKALPYAAYVYKVIGFSLLDRISATHNYQHHHDFYRTTYPWWHKCCLFGSTTS